MAVNQKFQTIEAIVYDCDGVLTDNKVIVDEDGKEYAVFNRGDGYAISKVFGLGIKQVVISTEVNPIVLKRCNKLQLEVYNGLSDKLSALKKYCDDNKIDLDNVLYVGNDLNDIDCMKSVGMRGCPFDAEKEIKDLSDWVSIKKGGDGVVRDLYRDICESRGIKCQ